MSKKNTEKTTETLGEISMVTTEDCGKIFEAAFFTPMSDVFAEQGGTQWGIPMIADSPPGGGKSTFWRRFAEKYLVRTHPKTGKKYRAYASITIGAQGEGRFGVVPVPVAQPDGLVALDFPPPADLIKAFPESRGLLVWDDLSTMPPALAPVALDGLQCRRIGTHYFGDGVRCMGATNCVEDAAGGWDVPPAVVNRAGWLQWPDYEASAVARYLQMGASMGTDAETPVTLEEMEARVLEAWPEAYSQASMLVAGFLTASPSMVRQQPKMLEAASSKRTAEPWASPRSIEMATRAIASAKVHGLNPAQKNAFVAALVGSVWANAYETYEVNADLPHPGDLLDGNAKFEFSRTRLDRVVVVLQACVALLANANCERREARAKEFWKLMKPMTVECGDLLAPAVQGMWRAKLCGMAEARPVLAAMEPLISSTRAK